jgi:hypothetical protein
MFGVSQSLLQITGYNHDSEKYFLIAENQTVIDLMGANVGVYDMTFISPTNFLISVFGGEVIIELNVKGDYVRTFASGFDKGVILTLLTATNILAIAAVGGVYFYDLEAISIDGGPLEKEEASLLSFAAGSDARAVWQGEFENEVLVTDIDMILYRRCIPGKVCRDDVDLQLTQSSGLVHDLKVLGDTGFFLLSHLNTEKVLKCT